MSRGGGKYGPAVYLAEVYVEPQGTGFSANARVYIEGASYFHNCGVLGQVQTMAEANDRWGKIDWREDGLHIGTGTNEYFLSRAKLESHR